MIINITNKSTLTTFQTEAKNGDVSRNKNNTPINNNIHTPCVSSDVQVSTDDQSKLITFNFIREFTTKTLPNKNSVVVYTFLYKKRCGKAGKNLDSSPLSIPHTHHLFHIHN